jgi:hypothetical protein
MKIGPKVTEKYFGQPVGNSQDPDEPWDKSAGTISTDGYKIGGRGSHGGGSKPSRNPGRTGSAALGSSRPRSAQKIRG